jgi:hypothetical protein
MAREDLSAPQRGHLKSCMVIWMKKAGHLSGSTQLKSLWTQAQLETALWNLKARAVKAM